MQKAGEEVSLNDYLTSYLKLFKTSFHAQVCLIESLSMDDTNLQQKIQKAKQNIFQLDTQNSGCQDLPTKINWKTLERFCLRINQFIQYRISKAKMLVQDSVINQLQNMCFSLQKLFAQLGKDKSIDEQHSIPDFFMRISDIQNRFMIKILRKVTQVNYKNHERTPGLMKQFLQSKIKKKFLREIPKLDELSSTQTPIGSRIIQHSHISNEYHYAARLRPRRTTIQKLQPVPSGIINPISFNPAFEYKSVITAQSQIIFKNLQQNFEVDQQYESNKLFPIQRESKMFQSMDNIPSFHMIKDIVDIQNDKNDRFNGQNLFRQLMENNRKNCIIIQKYRRKAKKIKVKMDKIEKLGINQESRVDIDGKHRRSNTLNTHRKDIIQRKQVKITGLPPLKRKITSKT